MSSLSLQVKVGSQMSSAPAVGTSPGVLPGLIFICHGAVTNPVTQPLPSYTFECQGGLRVLNATRVAVSILVIAILCSAQLARADGQTVSTCPCTTRPVLDGTISAGEWNATCGYQLQLQGPFRPDVDPQQNPIWVSITAPYYVGPSLQKNMTLYAMRDDQNVYLAYQWTHEPYGNVNKSASPDNYLLITAFDFDHDGKFEDNDNVTNTIDDALGLAYMGFDFRLYLRMCLCLFGSCGCSVWFDIFAPKGLYAISWNVTKGAEVIGGPPPGKIWTPTLEHPDWPEKNWTGVPGWGPLKPNGDPFSFEEAGSTRSPGGTSYDATYTYTVELAVPKFLFHSPAGFGFFLAQETGNETGDPSWPLWTWPSGLQQMRGDVGSMVQNASTAQLLGFLSDNIGASGTLDPGPAGPSPSPVAVGGVVTPADRVVLLLPLFAACGTAGVITAIWIARKRKT